MMEVSLFKTPNGEEFLRIELKKYDSESITAIMSIPGWFKAQAPMTYGLPIAQLGEFMKATENLLVVWKSVADNMGAIVKGIDTRDVPNDYIVDYRPKIELREHQIKAFNLLMIRDSLLIADQEGVGKTFPMLCSIEAKFKAGIAKTALWVTKAGLIFDVKNQANSATDLDVVVLGGTKKKRVDTYSQIQNNDKPQLIVVSYETYRVDIHHFDHINRTKGIDIMVIDESHKVKEPTTNAGKYIHRMNAPQRYAMSASPIINEIKDLYNILSWLGVINYNFFMFKHKFCELDQWGNVSKYRNLKEIKTMLQSNMLRRLKNEVLKDLPPVVFKNVYVDMTPAQKRLYKMVENNSEELDFEELEFEDVPSELAKYTRLMQVALSTEVVGGTEGLDGSAKLRELKDMLKEITERGEKAIVFSPSKRFTNILYKYFEDYNPAIITGDISTVAKGGAETSPRQAEVDKFQNDPSCKVIFCSASASREGWTGTAANNVIFVGKEFSPSYISQCIGRAWRFGAQQHQSINVYSIIANGTIDERVELLLEGKQDTIINMVETPMSTEEILKVLEGGK